MHKDIKKPRKNLSRRKDRFDHVFGDYIIGKGIKERKAFAKMKFACGKPKEYYLNDYYEDPMKYPPDLKIESRFRIYDNIDKCYYRSRNLRDVWKDAATAKKIISRMLNSNSTIKMEDRFAVVEVRLVPVSPVPDKAIPSLLSKPDKSEPQRGWVTAGKNRAKVKRKNAVLALHDEIDQIDTTLPEGIDVDQIDAIIADIEDVIENPEDTKVMNKNYTCECGKTNKFSAYVYAHWEERINHKCSCGNDNILLKGIMIK